MKRIILFLSYILFVGSLCAKPYKPFTFREDPQYLSTQLSQVEDTCPGKDPFHMFSCTKKQAEGFTCFDVYQVEGEPIPTQRYTLLEETLSEQFNSADPTCNFTGELTCANFLMSLNYNLDFSWFIANFPSSAFAQCSQTYTCTRIACGIPLPHPLESTPQSKKLTCVYRKEQTFFVGSSVTCKNKN